MTSRKALQLVVFFEGTKAWVHSHARAGECDGRHGFAQHRPARKARSEAEACEGPTKQSWTALPTLLSPFVETYMGGSSLFGVGTQMFDGLTGKPEGKVKSILGGAVWPALLGAAR